VPRVDLGKTEGIFPTCWALPRI